MEIQHTLHRRPVWILMFLALVLVWISEASAYESIVSRENAVMVGVQPEQLVNGRPVKFAVRMNTHSVPLTDDMVTASELRDDTGKTYRPVTWQGSPPGGHHRRGTLEFPALKGSPGKVRLVIKNVSDVPERVFEWKLGEK
ncbi:MAG: hypothetical protein K9K64_07645 [Desulfohalobiaceae bacterium]|nr:hypothetical protein [Desulfohalobiaceae bacterium]